MTLTLRPTVGHGWGSCHVGSDVTRVGCLRRTAALTAVAGLAFGLVLLTTTRSTLERGRQLRGSPQNSPQDGTRNPKGKSWYFVVVDSFARTNGDNKPCDTSVHGWCEGTIKGVTQHLDYIQGMGFDCVWITPVLKQLEGPDPDGISGYGNYGYWAYNWYAIDEHFGTAEDLLELSAELHKRGMCFVYDMVVNHVGPIHSAADVHKVYPFNETWYYNTPDIRNLSFDEYAGGVPANPPHQALGPGAMCRQDAGSCSNYACPVEVAFGSNCPLATAYRNETAPGPVHLPHCGLGDYCPGYNEQRTQDGWFFTLGDLNQSVPFVHDELIKWAKYMVRTYGIDGIRLDTAPYVPKDFLSDLQSAVGVPILGEVGTTNFSFFASYSPAIGPHVLDGLLNFHTSQVVPASFCGSFYPRAVLNLTRLGTDMALSLASGKISDLDLLGNFADNHDMARIVELCKGEQSRMANALAWTMFYKGIPIVYYGTEVFLKDTRESLWQHGWNTDAPGYKLLADMNRVRREQQLAVKEAEVKHAGSSTLIFTRGGDLDTWVFLNNLAETASTVKYCGATPPPAPVGQEWVDALSGEVAAFSAGCYLASGSAPRALRLINLRP
mmetsp:Transcript_44928/g.103850  ORF Transcript_44928/g.103850 Transcript_44928/m.103850 type:complete len:609 (-) Transcript_44928:171-1997(-)